MGKDILAACQQDDEDEEIRDDTSGAARSALGPGFIISFASRIKNSLSLKILLLGLIFMNREIVSTKPNIERSLFIAIANAFS